MKLSMDDSDGLSKDGFYLIALKVYNQGPKISENGQIWVFCYFLVYFSKTV